MALRQGLTTLFAACWVSEALTYGTKFTNYSDLQKDLLLPLRGHS